MALTRLHNQDYSVDFPFSAASRDSLGTALRFGQNDANVDNRGESPTDYNSARNNYIKNIENDGLKEDDLTQNI